MQTSQEDLTQRGYRTARETAAVAPAFFLRVSEHRGNVRHQVAEAAHALPWVPEGGAVRGFVYRCE